MKLKDKIILVTGGEGVSAGLLLWPARARELSLRSAPAPQEEGGVGATIVELKT